MSVNVAELIADLIRADVAPELVGQVVQEIFDARAEGAFSRVQEQKAQEAARQAKWRDIPMAEWMAMREVVLERDGYKCVYCDSDGGAFSLHCDHILPRSRGGASELSNLVTACHSCNSSKKDKTPQEWRAS